MFGPIGLSVFFDVFFDVVRDQGEDGGGAHRISVRLGGHACCSRAGICSWSAVSYVYRESGFINEVAEGDHTFDDTKVCSIFILWEDTEQTMKGLSNIF